MAQLPSMRVVFLVGADYPSTRDCIEAVCALPGIVPAGILLDTGRDSLRRRAKNLRGNLRREGYGYLFRRGIHALQDLTDKLVDRAVVSRDEIAAVLRKAFPERCFNLQEVAKKYGMDVRGVGNLNEPAAIRALEECRADLGIVLGTRILKPATFSAPRLGCINLHKGKVPEYRGTPPGFWEIYDGAASAEVTVHFVASKLDAGDVIETAPVAILPVDSPDSLMEKLDQASVGALTSAVRKLQSGAAEPRPQPHSDHKPRRKPTHRDLVEFWKRRPDLAPRQSAVAKIVKNLASLAIYRAGLYGFVRKRRKGSRAVIVLYHRVNDFSRDPLTVDTEMFAAHLLAIQRWYPAITTTELVDRLRQKKSVAPTSALVHFDDAYRDVYTNGASILKAVGFPATAFVNSGFVDTDREFAHDRQLFPFRYENCRREDLQKWVESGFEVGAHTVNHVNLGECDLAVARTEIVNSGSELREMTGRDVPLFSFPFGRIQDIREEVKDYIREAGYAALFSAHGGFVGEETSLWDIPRIGASSGHKPLYLLLEIEELDWATLATRAKRLLSGKAVAPKPSASRSA